MLHKTKKHQILKKNSTKKIRFLAGAIACLAIVFCSIKIVSAIKYNAITIAGTTGNITVNGNIISDLEITPALVFNQTGDSITYKLSLSNPDNQPFQIKSVSDDNTNQYITTTYDYDKEMNEKEKPILVTLAYQNYVPFGEEVSLNDIHIAIDIDEETPAANTDGENTIGVPDTGANTTKYLQPSIHTDNQPVLPYIIICIISIASIITIIPRKHRVKFGKIVSVFAVVIIGGTAYSAFAEPAKLELTIHGASISAIPDTSNPQEVVTTVFPNIYNNKVQDRTNQAAGNAIILKTLDNKYVLMDTGPSTEDIRSVIYNTLAELQGDSHVTIDYLVISHLDGDHYGNAVSFINNENFNFKNIVLKHEIKKESVFQSITKAAATHNIEIITSGDDATQEYLTSLGVQNYNKITEGEAINVGKYLKLDFFNTVDTYKDKECKSGMEISWTASTSLPDNRYIKTDDNKYIYFDGSEYSTDFNNEHPVTSSKYPYSNVTYKTTSTLAPKEGGSGMNRYYYAIVSSTEKTTCQSNDNSFGILAEIATTGLKKYMYFPGDLQNDGYSHLSNGSRLLYSDNITFKDGDFSDNITPYVIPSEDNTSIAIYNKLASDASALGQQVETLLNNIVVYQSSHHGWNNSEKAVWTLGLNRSNGLYVIQESDFDYTTTDSFASTKVYYYTLNKIPAEKHVKVGDPSIEGVNCTINTIGETVCNKY